MKMSDFSLQKKRKADMKGDANGAPKAKKSKGDSESSDEGDSSDDEEEEKMEVEKPAAAAEATNGKAAANGKKEESSSEEDSSDEEEEEKPKQNGKGQFFHLLTYLPTYLHTLASLFWTIRKKA